jgi:hypothetical protein
MISTSHNFIFVHIPKTGGNSIQTVLARYCDDEVTFKPSVGKVRHEDGAQGLDVTNRTFGLVKHATLKDYRDALGARLSSFFIFAAIRNPYDRVISSTAFSKGGIAGPLDFEAMRLPRAQLDFLLLDGKVAVTNFIRFETMQADFDRICDRIGVPRESLPHKNASVRDHYAQYYTERAKLKVRLHYRQEFEVFNYGFEETAPAA